MRMPAKKYLIGAALLAVLGAGVAEAATAQLHTIKVAAPDGAVVHVEYSGNVAPKVEVLPANASRDAAAFDAPEFDAMDPFARMDRISAMMDAQMHAMMQRAAVLQQQTSQMQQHAVLASQAAPNANGAPGFALAGTMPKGMHMTYYSSSSDANGCTRTVSYSSDGSGAATKVTQAASDGCDAAKPSTQAIPAKLEKSVEQNPASGPKV